MAEFFGTNGVRGKFDFLGPALAMKIAAAIGAYFKHGKIIVARDGRLTGDVLRHAIKAGLMSVGCEVVDLDYCSAPTAEFMVKKLKANGLIIITASHNPPEWNAMKVVDGKGVTVSKERGEEIEKLIGKTDAAPWDKVGGCTKVENAHEEHIAAIAKLVDGRKIAGKRPKLVLDCGNGMAALIAPKLMEGLGCEVIAINDEVDGRFPGRPSEPSEANVQELIARVKKEKADGGIAWDGDGDRVTMVDDKGRYMIGDKVFAVSEMLKLREKKGLVVTTVATSMAIEDIAKRHGCRMAYTKIGAPYLSEKVLAEKAAIGGEEVGGVIWPELSLAKDGFLTAAKVVEGMCEKPLSAWLDDVPVYYNEKAKVPAEGGQKARAVAAVAEYAKKEKLDTISVDGVRINMEGSWVIARPSGTENYVRVFAESKDSKKAKELLKKYEKIAKSAV